MFLPTVSVFTHLNDLETLQDTDKRIKEWDKSYNLIVFYLFTAYLATYKSKLNHLLYLNVLIGFSALPLLYIDRWQLS